MYGRIMLRLAMAFCFVCFASDACSVAANEPTDPDSGQRVFQSPPDDARPGVYWYFMDGNLTREGMTADLESMRDVGIGNLVFLEVNVGVPRGPIDFLSERWQELFTHAVRETERLGIDMTLGSGPGWAGSGGPWVKMEQSMQHLVASSTTARGPATFSQVLARPDPRTPFFGEASVPEALRKKRERFYRDVAVLAFPTPSKEYEIADVDEKALYYRAPYSSTPNVKPYLPALAKYAALPADMVVQREKIIDLTRRLKPDGRLVWDVQPGDWTIMRFGRRNTGATTRPAPDPGFGFECDKFSAAAFDAHFEHYIGTLLRKVGKRPADRGWTMVHIDSWEMGSQNWTEQFRDEFQRRRGYDLLPFLPTYTGQVVESLEMSERFLWDVRLTAQELVLENHAKHFKELGSRYGLGLSIEPYDMNPTADLELGSVADVPMCEFWSEGYGFDTAYSCFEATSIAHTNGRRIVAAEAFTATDKEGWKMYPGAAKNQGDWAFCMGINRFVYHTFAHKPHGDRPGMTMGPYGVHWDRGQTWWPMAGPYHRYIARCQNMLRQGSPVADICYLTPEGAPQVFRPPPSAVEAHGTLRDRRGYNFDGCAPHTLMTKAQVRYGQVVFPGGAAYRLLVLPAFETMTPELIGKIKELVVAGATVVGSPPRKSPSLVDYPQCDSRVQALATSLWGDLKPTPEIRLHRFGKGAVVSGGSLHVDPPGTPQKGPIVGAQWIWYPEGKPAVAAPLATRYFRREFVIEPTRDIESARLEITADNAYELWINGQQVGTGSNFHEIRSWNVTHQLHEGNNVLAIAVDNGGQTANPAGLVAGLEVRFAAGDSIRIVTDARWKAARAVGKPWRNATRSVGSWKNAQELGSLTMLPWRVSAPVNTCPELYPHYKATARLLAELNVPPDFVSDGPIRYTHRRSVPRDIYFVSNREAKRVAATCTFRIADTQPELWDPLTGAIRKLPDYSEQAGCTSIPMRFEPHQSFFVVFPKAGHETGGIEIPPANFATYETVDQIDGPWKVAFDPHIDGPEQRSFPELVDWSRQADPAVKYFSGIATYRRTFDLPEELREDLQGDLRESGQHVWLDLGTVQNIARLRLNGHDLGVVWCAPWQVDIAGVVKLTGNRLEIEVANLWPNRLIGDKNVPPDQRVAKTNFNSYRADSPLLPSGLLGPVTLKTER